MTSNVDDRPALELISEFEVLTAPGPFTATRLRTVLEEGVDRSEPITARLLACLAQSERFRSPDEAARLAERALSLARGPGERMEAIRVATRIYWSPLHLDRLDELAVELVELARERESLAHLAHGLSARLFVATARGQVGLRRNRLTQLRQVCRLADNHKITCYQVQHEAQLALAFGDRQEVARVAPLLTEAAAVSEDDVAIQSAMAFALFDEWTRGSDGPGHDLATVKAETDPWLIAWNIAMLSTLCQPGHEETVAAGLRRTIGADIGDLAPNALWLGQTVLIADLARFADDRPLGAACHRLLKPHADLYAPLGGALCVGSTWFGLAAASAAAGEIDRSIDEYDRAVEANERVGYRFWATASRGRKAELLYRCGRPGAARLVEEAMAQATAMELWPLVRTLQALEETESPSPLSRREREVVAQVAQAKTNKEIADALFISVKTVERHLANVACKLDTSSRVELALWAVDHRSLGTDHH